MGKDRGRLTGLGGVVPRGHKGRVPELAQAIVDAIGIPGGQQAKHIRDRNRVPAVAGKDGQPEDAEGPQFIHFVLAAATGFQAVITDGPQIEFRGQGRCRRLVCGRGQLGQLDQKSRVGVDHGKVETVAGAILGVRQGIGRAIHTGPRLRALTLGAGPDAAIGAPHQHQRVSLATLPRAQQSHLCIGQGDGASGPILPGRPIPTAHVDRGKAGAGSTVCLHPGQIRQTILVDVPGGQQLHPAGGLGPEALGKAVFAPGKEDQIPGHIGRCAVGVQILHQQIVHAIAGEILHQELAAGQLAAAFQPFPQDGRVVGRGRQDRIHEGGQLGKIRRAEVEGIGQGVRLDNRRYSFGHNRCFGHDRSFGHNPCFSDEGGLRDHSGLCDRDRLWGGGGCRLHNRCGLRGGGGGDRNQGEGGNGRDGGGGGGLGSLPRLGQPGHVGRRRHQDPLLPIEDLV